MTADDFQIRTTLQPGDLGRITALHGTEYPPEEGYGIRFEAYVARTLAEFIIDNDGAGVVWMAERHGQLEGCAAIVYRPHDTAQLRWVLVSRQARGLGLGRRLVEAALAHCRIRGCQRVFLETTDRLEASIALYRSLGFRLISEQVEELWAGPRPLIIMELALR